MRKVECAFADGCTRVQRIFLVDETLERDEETKTLRILMWIVLEFIPGETLLDHPDMEKYIAKIPDALREIHRYKLTQRDCNLDNFIVAGEEIKIIDIHFFSDFFFRQMYLTVCKLKQFYDLDVPVDGVLNRLLFWTSDAVYRALKFFGLSSRKEWKKNIRQRPLAPHDP